MRFNLILFVSLLVFTLSGQKFDYGIKLGTGISKVPNTNVTSDDASIDFGSLKHAAVLTFHGGFWGEILLSDGWSLQPELLWTQQALQDRELKDRGIEGHLEFNYLSVPVLVAYQPLPRLKLAVGPQLSFLVADRIRGTENAGESNPALTEESNWELGANLEVSYQIARWRVGLRAHRDLTAFWSFEATDVNGAPFGSYNLRHQSLNLWVGYALR